MSEEKRQQTPGQAARIEAAEQSVALVFTMVTLAATLGAIAMQRAMTDADFARSLRMAAAQRAENLCARIGFKALAAAERFRLKYEAERA